MNKLVRLVRSIKKHHKATLFMLLITLAIFSYQEYASENRDRITNSHIDAAFRAQNNNEHGGNAQLFKNPDGTYGVQFSPSFHDDGTVKECLSIVLTKANGTVIASPPC